MTIDAQAAHPVLACAEAMLAALGDVADVPAVFMSTEAKKPALVDLARVEAAVAELKGRVMATAADVAEEAGARDVAAWLAHATRDEPRRTHADLSLAKALPDRLAALEETARARSSLRSRSLGEGMSRTTWVHPTSEADRLLAYADAYTNPRRPDTSEAAATHGGLSDWETIALHHHRLHAPQRYDWTRLPDGRVRFHRRE